MYNKYIFERKPLPYPENALEPWIDSFTVSLHHGMHQQNYVDQLNRTLAPYPHLHDWPLDRLLKHLLLLPPGIITSVRNFAGGIHNHDLYWESTAPAGTDAAGGRPTGKLETAIQREFGSFAEFQEEFTRQSRMQFGSGNVFLAMDQHQELQILPLENQDNPLTLGFCPLMMLDLWEHAYYLLYQNRKADYIANWWKLVNWPAISAKYQKLESNSC